MKCLYLHIVSFTRLKWCVSPISISGIDKGLSSGENIEMLNLDKLQSTYPLSVLSGLYLYVYTKRGINSDVSEMTNPLTNTAN